MDIQTLKMFFMWCTMINASVLFLWAIIFSLAPDLVYRMQTKWFPISRETFSVVFYSFLGLFKVIFLIFNAAPYIALLIIG